MSNIKVTCSAPGKVMIAGGYIVLESQYSGLVIGLDAKGYATTTTLESRQLQIHVKSPQFIDAEWHYQLNAETNPISVNQISAKDGKPTNCSPNPFVQCAIFYTVNALFHTETLKTKWRDLSIVIEMDNAYYNQPELLAGQTAYPRFNPLRCKIENVKKTGLGSSAAMITSLTASLYTTMQTLLSSATEAPKDLDEQTRTLIHNLSQLAHCSAQGKVGSGFDVAAATYGSCVYRRFDTAIIQDLLVTYNDQPNDNTFTDRLCKAVNRPWTRVVPFVLPREWKLLMGDIAGGSQTPGMVKKVLAWKKSNPEQGKKDFDCLHDQLKTIAACFETANEGDTEKKLRTAFTTIRKTLQHITKVAVVDIEPEQQTKILDAVEQIPGVLGTGVPGAGGFDAQFCICKNDPSVENAVYSRWRELNVVPMTVGPVDRGLSIE
ncbi:phosphomevalonate kinase [Schizosaccharomyces japonicus yFS275]|uniref:Phosphomevalonate kinase n=1 Tax=Schizosaccharomyces japonicus (strain yFS275 / FY16936) TaxID=402676 RepID=B6JY15_SCHJY|nr:phosphomevalonate kinase [Schizosaccharomyces japonicus yFS275]EEB06433.2 phosphomevalonate kinase [Schizosaccharomyces japonicus yFS275]